MELDAAREPTLLSRREVNHQAAQFSPDGEWIVHVSSERGSTDVYLKRVDGTEESTYVAPGTAPLWSPNGGQIFFSSGDRLKRVEVSLEGTRRVGEPSVVFDNPGYELRRGPNAQYDVTPDGETFLVLAEPIESDTPRIQVVVNWRDELERLLRSGTE